MFTRGPRALLKFLCQENAPCRKGVRWRFIVKSPFSTECANATAGEEMPVKKLLKIAIVGPPNVGKSTLINQVVGRRVFAISKKVHTTKSRARAVCVEGNTQLVFLDTPGLVTHKEFKKYNLSPEFLSGGEYATNEADVIGVIHDLSNTFTRDRLDPKVLRLLHLSPEKESFLVMNKIDTLKSKRTLLDLSQKLTGQKLKDYEKEVQHEQLTESEIWGKIKQEPYWEHFSDVFMVSALLGSGTSDLKNYLLGAAKPSEWMFEGHIFSDQSPQTIIEEAVRSKLLENLPQEVPYMLSVQLEYLDMSEEDIKAVVLVGCNSPKTERMIMGGGGNRIRLISKEAEAAISDAFLTSVHLRVVVVQKPKQPKGFPPSIERAGAHPSLSAPEKN